MYKVGDKVVYPHHGAGTVVKREKKDVLGEKREYLTIKILHNDMTVNVPADNAERVGLRKVIDEEAVKKVVKYLTSGGTEKMFAQQAGLSMDESHRVLQLVAEPERPAGLVIARTRP